MTDPFLELRERVAVANNEIHAAGLVVHAFGNASEADRESGVFAIKPSGIPCAEVTPEDIVVLPLGGGDAISGSHRPSSDTPTHRAIYNGLSEVGGVAHTHSLYATSWAQARRSIPCLGTTHADHFRGPVPVTRPLSRDEVEGDYEANTGSVIVEMFGDDGLSAEDMPGALVASHGPFTWGATAGAAVTIAAALEMIAHLAFNTMSIDSGQSSVEPALLDRHFSRKHGPMAYYGQP